MIGSSPWPLYARALSFAEVAAEECCRCRAVRGEELRGCTATSASCKSESKKSNRKPQPHGLQRLRLLQRRHTAAPQCLTIAIEEKAYMFLNTRFQLFLNRTHFCFIHAHPRAQCRHTFQRTCGVRGVGLIRTASLFVSFSPLHSFVRKILGRGAVALHHKTTLSNCGFDCRASEMQIHRCRLTRFDARGAEVSSHRYELVAPQYPRSVIPLTSRVTEPLSADCLLISVSDVRSSQSPT